MSSVIGVLGRPEDEVEEVVNDETEDEGEGTTSPADAIGKVIVMRKRQNDMVPMKWMMGDESVGDFCVQQSTLWRFLSGVHCDRKSFMAIILDDGQVDDLVVVIVGLDL